MFIMIPDSLRCVIIDLLSQYWPHLETIKIQDLSKVFDKMKDDETRWHLGLGVV